MSEISVIKPLVNTQLLTQYNDMICKEVNIFNAEEILVKYISNNSPSGGLNGDYWLDTTSNKPIIKIKSSTGWEIVILQQLPILYVIRYPDYTFYNVYYNLSNNGELEYIDPVLDYCLRISSKIYRYYLSLNLLSSGRYLNVMPALPKTVYDIALGVTDGTYTTPTFTNGQILTTNANTYSLINGTWTKLN